MSDRLGVPAVPAEKQFEVLGRLLLVLQRGCDASGTVPGFDYWPAVGGGFVLEWAHGAYAQELVNDMLQSLQDSDSSVLAPTDIIQRADIVSDVEHRLFLLIHGVPVEFRSSEPVGARAARARAARARRLASAHA